MATQQPSALTSPSSPSPMHAPAAAASPPQTHPPTKRPRLTADSRGPNSNSDSNSNSDADQGQERGRATPTQDPGTLTQDRTPAPRRHLKPYRLPAAASAGGAGGAGGESAAHAQAAHLRDRLLQDLRAEHAFLADMSAAVAAEYSRTLLEQYHLRATHAQWASLPDSDPFWAQPEVLLHFASVAAAETPDESHVDHEMDSRTFSDDQGEPPLDDLFSTVRGNDDDADDLASLFAFLPVPSSVSPHAGGGVDHGLCLNPLDLDLDTPGDHGKGDDPLLDLDTLDVLLGPLLREQSHPLAGRPPPTPTQLIHELAAREEARRDDRAAGMQVVEEGSEDGEEPHSIPRGDT